ncbi:Retrotransposon like protein [Phytophthora palmivora]|uniref:Retrotransposon like protein n=1 Tax=Phytophthora palmivora TaxID=4796 RepID=A0A2P4XPU8_9STRA|nr:Retrotransposon like protein [Phytophthora palmivora]
MRDRIVTRSAGARSARGGGESGRQEELGRQEETGLDVVNNVIDADPKNYRESMRRRLKEKWLEAMSDELSALEANNARLVACGNEQEFGVNYGITFAGVIEMTSVKQILVLARKWRVPAKFGDVPNVYVKAEKEADLDIFIHVPKGMTILDEVMKRLGVTSSDELMLELRKALYGLKQAVRLWSKRLHKKLVEIGFVQRLVDMCVYFRTRAGVLVVVGVYVDDLLVTGTKQQAVDAFFEELASISVNDLGRAHKFLGVRINYDDESG